MFKSVDLPEPFPPMTVKKGLSQNTVKCDETAPFSWVKREMLSCKCFRKVPSRKPMGWKVVKPGEFGEKGKRK